tara:strand:+ start:217 stop:1662 length:1446 start_codon:yes stop_codon:yes gene_type:complete
MKNYLSKIKNHLSSIGNFKIRNFITYFTNKNPFSVIISLISLVFLFSLYFTIPAFYNYENFDKEIQKKVSKDFKLNIKNISNVTYLILPTPHFLIEECDIYFLDEPKEKILKAKYLKINIFSKNLHNKEKIEIKNIYLNKVDIDLQFVDIKNFYSHLKYNITKPIYLKNSNLFFRDKYKEIISISKIKNFEYFFDFQNKEKKLNILGKLFGSDFSFIWEKNFSNPYVTKSDIKFKNPNLSILNNFNKNNKNFTKAQTNIKFLTHNLDLNYKFNKKSVEFINDKSKKINHSKLIGDIKLDPFFFDLNLILSGIYFETVINNILLNLHKTNQSVNLSFNGNLKINLNEINNRLFENLYININFLEEKISFKEVSLNLKKIGKINFFDTLIFERNQKIFVKSKIKFDVDNQQELFRRFLIPRQNRVDLNKVFFEIEYNVDDGNYFISSINFNEKNNDQVIFYEISNIQQLNNLISREFRKVSLE